MINTIGPVWDGNEVWLLVAGGATFAAFPEWYATLFSGFYLPLLLILVALIVRGVAFEYRGKRDDDRVAGALGRARSSSARSCPALLWGVAFANIVRGVPIDADKEYTGGFFNLLNPYALLGGADHAAAVPHPRRDVPRAQDRRRRSGTGPGPWRSGSASRPPSSRSRSWSGPRSTTGNVGSAVLFVLAAVALVAGLAARVRAGREGWAFLGTFVAIALGVAGPVRRRCSPTSCRPRSTAASQPDDHATPSADARTR